MAGTPAHQHRSSQGQTIGITSAVWAGSILLSRILGLLREQIIGRTLGASRQADLYFASFTLPDFLNYQLAAGALSIVFGDVRKPAWVALRKEAQIGVEFLSAAPPWEKFRDQARNL